MSEQPSVLKSHFLKIFRHMKWADESALNLLAMKNIHEGRVYELLSHIIIAESTWFKRIRGEFYDNQFWNLLSHEEIKQLIEESNSRFVNYISMLDEKDFQKMISYRNSKGIDYVTSVEDILTHIALHGMYHRGQIMLLMRNQVNDVVVTDYAMYVREYEH